MSDYMEIWKLRKEALEEFLGDASDQVSFSPMPIYLGGFADVMRFDGYVKGFTYVTGGLIGLGSQKPSSMGHYELMMCTREPSDFAPNLISRVARYTHDAVLKWGDTMDIGPAVPPPSSIKGLVFAEPQLPARKFQVQNKPCHLVLCIGITAAELTFTQKKGASPLVEKLMASGIFPYTDIQRKSVI